MHIDHEHTAGGAHEHEHTHSHSHEHTHADGTVHSHEHTHEHAHDHGHPHSHEELHAMGIPHSHDHEEAGCAHECSSCASKCEHTPMEELTALMQYMVGHNAAHTRELADLAAQLDHVGNHTAYEQVMAAVSDFEKGNMRLSVILTSLKGE